jgi:DNA-binding transcriptional MocR family regulator
MTSLPGFVLGYAAHTPDRLHEAVRRLAQALRMLRPADPPDASASNP